MFMRFASATIVTTWILQSLTVSFLSAANPTLQTQAAPGVSSAISVNTAPTPAELLKQAVEIAQHGDVQGGLAKAKDAKQLSQQTGQFGSMVVVEYLNTVRQLVEFAQADQIDSLQSEAVSTVDQFISQLDFDGRGNPQVSYYFMTGIKQTADAFLPYNRDCFVRLQLQQGGIARNLKQNPNYPADGKQFLADSLAGLALGLLLKNDIAAANQALTEACELGFCEFENLNQSKALEQLKDRSEFDRHVSQLQDRYLASLKQWSADEISRFQGFRFNFHVDSIKGGSLSSRDQEGQITVIDLWATWCPPCREALPHFNRLQQDYRNLGVRVIGISMDSPDDPSRSMTVVREFMREHNFRFACGMGTHDLKNQLPAEMKLPTTLFVDRSGTVRYMSNGYQDYAKVAAITETLVNEKLPVSTPVQPTLRQH